MQPGMPNFAKIVPAAGDLLWAAPAMGLIGRVPCSCRGCWSTPVAPETCFLWANQAERGKHEGRDVRFLNVVSTCNDAYGQVFGGWFEELYEISFPVLCH